jgi:hypothetical protein
MLLTLINQFVSLGLARSRTILAKFMPDRVLDRLLLSLIKSP